MFSVDGEGAGGRVPSLEERAGVERLELWNSTLVFWSARRMESLVGWTWSRASLSSVGETYAHGGGCGRGVVPCLLPRGTGVRVWGRAGRWSFFGVDCDGCACLEVLGLVERRENVSWSGCGVGQLAGLVCSPP